MCLSALTHKLHMNATSENIAPFEMLMALILSKLQARALQLAIQY